MARKRSSIVCHSLHHQQIYEIVLQYQYDDLRPQSFEERLANLEPGSIRRSDYATDNGNNVRTTTSGLKAFSSEDYMNAMLSRSASIFNPDMIAITEEFLNSQAETSNQAVADLAQKREAKASRHNTWEEKQLNTIRKSNVVNSRAHSILRTSNDTESNSQFGMIDPNLLDARENMRFANQEKNRMDRLAIKKNNEENMNYNSQQRAKTVSEIYSSIDLKFDDLD